MSAPSPLQTHVDQLQSQGRYYFTRRQVADALEMSALALDQVLHRLGKKGRIVRVRSGFYTILPLEYRASGIIPPDWFIHPLMDHLGWPYYVGLLTAARLHGAGHQAAQEFQVLTDRPRHPIDVAGLRIRLVQKRHLSETFTLSVPVSTGWMNVSTPEATALDLARYPHIAGGLDNVATVLGELAERLDPDKLVEAAKREADHGMAFVQRLGYLLEFVEQGTAVEPLRAWLQGRRFRVVPLRPDRPSQGAPAGNPWRVAVNDTVEADL